MLSTAPCGCAESLLLPVHVLPPCMPVLKIEEAEVENVNVFETLYGLCGERVTQ